MRNYYVEINQYLQRLIKNILIYDREGIDIEGCSLSILELLIIDFLGNEGQKKMYEVIEILNIDRNSLVTIINNLQQKKYITKTKSIKDKRAQILDLTQEGNRIYEKITSSNKELLFSLLNDFSFNEEKAVLKFLVKLDMLSKEKVANSLKLYIDSTKNL